MRVGAQISCFFGINCGHMAKVGDTAFRKRQRRCVFLFLRVLDVHILFFCFSALSHRLLFLCFPLFHTHTCVLSANESLGHAIPSAAHSCSSILKMVSLKYCCSFSLA